MACNKGRTDIINFLLNCGADVNVADDDGNTPLHYAADGWVKIAAGFDNINGFKFFRCWLLLYANAWVWINVHEYVTCIDDFLKFQIRVLPVFFFCII